MTASEVAAPAPARELRPVPYRSRQLPALVAAGACGALAPVFVQGQYAVGLANTALVYVVLAIGFYYVFALGGQFSFAHNVFFAVGGFSGAWMSLHAGFWPSFLFSIAAGTAAALAFKLIVLRVTAIYFAIATLALSQIAGILWTNWPSFTGGFTGVPVSGVPSLFSYHADTPERMYWFLLGITLLALLLSILIERSPVRRRMLATRDIPTVAMTFGLNTRLAEIFAFSIGGAFAGAAGCLYAYLAGFVSPDSFGIEISLLVLLMVLLGGTSAVWGAVIGAVFLTWLPNALRSVTTHSDLVYAVLILVVILAFPGGAIGVLHRARGALDRHPRA
jgi:branched-chain amino acid transport system permease protein